MRSLATIDADVSRVKKNLEELTVRMKKLEAERTEAENSEIINAVRSGKGDIYALQKRYAKAAKPVKNQTTSIKKEQEETNQ